MNNSIGKQLKTLDCMLIDHQIASCVISGNVRRSARMSLCHWNDPTIFDFIDCKLNDPTQHWTTNISVEIDEDWFRAVQNGHLHALAVLDRVAHGMIKNGEPGFFNSTLASVGENEHIRISNPCGEIAMGNWSNCNLGHVNLAAHGTNLNAAVEAARLMTRFLIEQRSVTSSHQSNKKLSQENEESEWDCSVYKNGQLLMVSNGLRLSIRGTCRIPSRATACNRSEAADYADELGIPIPIKTTTIAPTGTIAKLSGHSEGIHPIFAKYFVQRVDSLAR